MTKKHSLIQNSILLSCTAMCLGIAVFAAGCNHRHEQSDVGEIAQNAVLPESDRMESVSPASESASESGSASDEAVQPEVERAHDIDVIPVTPETVQEESPASESKPDESQPNAEPEVTDDRDAIGEEILECYPCINTKNFECSSDVSCDSAITLAKKSIYLNRYFDKNQASFNTRFKALQREINKCVREYVERDSYTAASEPNCDHVLNEYSTLLMLESEKADAEWLKKHKLSDDYRMKNHKSIEYKEYPKSGYIVENSFVFDEDNPSLLPDIINNGTIDPNKRDKNGNTLMHLYGDERVIVNALIENGADISLKNKDGQVAFYAIAPSLRRQLILSGLDTKRVIDSDGNTVLHSYANDTEIAQVLIKSGLNVNQKNKEGRTPIFYANNLDAYKYLISEGADIKAKDNHQNTLLHAALNVDVLSYLSGQGLDINAPNDVGQTPVFFANSADALKFYIDHGADVKVIDKHGNSLLHSNVDARLMLLNYGLDIHAKNDEGQTPLFFVDLNRTDVLSAYIEAGADINARDKHGNTIVHYQFASDSSWSLLVQSGFNINIKNHRNEPAWFARYKQSRMQSEYAWDNEQSEYQILSEYLKLGADVNVRDKFGNTLLHKTLKCGKKDNKYIDCYDDSLIFNESRIKTLLKSGIDVNARNEEGFTPIFSCYSNDDSSSDPYRLDSGCFNLYKKLGADIHVTTEKGDNLFTECIRYGCGSYDIIVKNQIHQNVSDTTKQRAIDLYKTAVFDYDKSCKHWRLYDPVDASIDSYCNRYSSDRQIMPFLIDYGLDLNDGYMCILGAPEPANDAQKQKIAESINLKICGYGSTALNQRDWSESEIDRFIRVGADINTQDNNGETPLMKIGIGILGTDFGPVDCLDVDRIIQFVKNGADVNLRDSFGKTILDNVIPFLGNNDYCPDTRCADSEQCDFDIAAYLIKNGANINNRDNEGKTVLMNAVEYNNEKLIKLLIHKGADATVKDNGGKSVLDYAEYCSDEVIELLKAKGRLY